MRIKIPCSSSRPTTDEAADSRLTHSLRCGDSAAFARRAKALGGRLVSEMARQDAFLAVVLADCPDGYARLEERTTAPERARLCRAGHFLPLWRAVEVGNLPMVRGLLADVPPAQLGAAWGTPAGQEALLCGLVRGRVPARQAMRILLCEQVIARPLGEASAHWQTRWRGELAREGGGIAAAPACGVGEPCRPAHPSPTAPARP